MPRAKAKCTIRTVNTGQEGESVYALGYKQTVRGAITIDHDRIRHASADTMADYIDLLQHAQSQHDQLSACTGVAPANALQAAGFVRTNQGWQWSKQ